MRSAKAFSLIELVLIAGIVAVLIALTLPVFSLVREDRGMRRPWRTCAVTPRLSNYTSVIGGTRSLRLRSESPVQHPVDPGLGHR